MKLIFENYGIRYTVEADQEDYNADDLKEIFDRMLVQSGFSPNVISGLGDGGHYEYLDDGEIVIKKERLEELEEKEARLNDLKKINNPSE